MKRVLVTGLGVISSIGNNVEENLNSLRNGQTGIRKARYLRSKYQDDFLFGEIPLSDSDLRSMIGKEQVPGLARTDLLAFKAFEEAIADAGLKPEQLSSFSTALISASTVGGMCQTNQLYQDIKPETETSEFVDTYSCSAHMMQLVKSHQMKGYTDTINTACSSSANAILIGAELIQSGRADRVIVGGSDSLAKFTVNGFKSLGILSTEPCQPFDANRKGLTLGEAAAYLVLESEDVVKDKEVYAVVDGYGNSNDAHHASALSEEATGIKMVLRQALEIANRSEEEIDYINMHGTATENNDGIELKGIQDILGRIPPYNSTKSYTGHTLGAAGAVEAIYSILAMKHGELFPSLHFQTPIDSFPGPVIQFQKEQKIRHVLSNSFGFAGNCTTLLFSAPK